MRIVFMGCVEFSYHALTKLLTVQEAEVVGIVTQEFSTFNSDFRSLQPVADSTGIPCLIVRGNDQERISKWLVELAPDVIYCFGWSYLLGSPVLQIPRLGVIGYHPAALPRNRGRHPVIWALALGLEQTASTFFFMDEGADSGDILSQRTVPITPEDNATTLYQKLIYTALEQIPCFTRDLATGSYDRTPQDHSISNYWRKRSKSDGRVDWRMSADAICNLIRALAPPYPGAHCIVAGTEVKIWSAEPLRMDSAHHEPGKVLSSDASGIVVKCSHGAVRLIDHEFDPLPEEGSYL